MVACLTPCSIALMQVEIFGFIPPAINYLRMIFFALTIDKEEINLSF